MKPEDLGRWTECSDPRLSPDASVVAYVVTTIDLDANKYRSAVWMAATDGAAPPRRLTAADGRAMRPRWSPDGERLAYVERSGAPRAELRVGIVGRVGSSGGRGPFASAVLVDWPEDIEELAWTPDGSRVVMTARDRDEERYAKEADRDRPARRITRTQYRLDGAGWTADRPRHVFSIASDGSSDGTPVALTGGEFSELGVTVSPDGGHVVFSSARTDTWDTDLSTHLYRVPIDGGEIEQLTTGTTLHNAPAWSLDGKHIAFVSGDRHSYARHGQVGLIEADGRSPRAERALTSPLDRNCCPYLANAREPVWVGDTVVFQVDEAGNVPLYRAALDGKVEQVVGGDRQVTGFDAGAGGVIVATISSATTIAEVVVIDDDGNERVLTDHGTAFHNEVGAAAPERFVALSADGTEVEAWLIRPPTLAAGERCPVLVNVHGGPFAQYGNRFFDEFQIQAGAGYAVLYCNPRGSSGYSEAFARATRGPKAAVDPGSGWGGVDYEDLMAVVDAALSRFAFLDGDRMGVIGGSYGGYMTTWTVGHTDRFAAAVSERACNNLLTFAHTADIGSWFPACYIGTSHLDDPEEFVRQSPVTYYRDIHTPLLILHSENDLRCPVEQAEDLYLRLRSVGAEVDFWRFPGESHELSRAGAPQHRMQRAHLILDWFDRHLR